MLIGRENQRIYITTVDDRSNHKYVIHRTQLETYSATLAGHNLFKLWLSIISVVRVTIVCSCYIYLDILSSTMYHILQTIGGFLQKTRAKAEAGDTTAGLVNQLNLEEFASVLDNAPPGTDELVALSKASWWTRGHAYYPRPSFSSPRNRDKLIM